MQSPAVHAVRARDTPRNMAGGPAAVDTLLWRNAWAALPSTAVIPCKITALATSKSIPLPGGSLLTRINRTAGFPVR
jgi:hypothetical protein